jgi:zinc protease
VVGDFEEGKAKKLIEKYFGPIPRQTDPPKPDVTESPLTSVQRKTLTDPLARLVRYEMDFKTVQSTHPDAEALEILASILSSGRTGRLYSAITEKRLALAADASSYTGRGPGAFSLEGTLPPGGSVEALEAAFDAEIDKVRTEGVTEAELQKAKTQARARTIVGGGGGRAGLQTALGKANMLAQNAIFWNDPGRFNTQIQRIQAVTAADVKRVANTYLKKDARVVLVDGPATAPTAGGGQ